MDLSVNAELIIVDVIPKVFVTCAGGNLSVVYHNQGWLSK